MSTPQVLKLKIDRLADILRVQRKKYEKEIEYENKHVQFLEDSFETMAFSTASVRRKLKKIGFIQYGGPSGNISRDGSLPSISKVNLHDEFESSELKGVNFSLDSKRNDSMNIFPKTARPLTNKLNSYFSALNTDRNRISQDYVNIESGSQLDLNHLGLKVNLNSKRSNKSRIARPMASTNDAKSINLSQFLTKKNSQNKFSNLTLGGALNISKESWKDSSGLKQKKLETSHNISSPKLYNGVNSLSSNFFSRTNQQPSSNVVNKLTVITNNKYQHFPGKVSPAPHRKLVGSQRTARNKAPDTTELKSGRKPRKEGLEKVGVDHQIENHGLVDFWIQAKAKWSKC